MTQERSWGKKQDLRSQARARAFNSDRKFRRYWLEVTGDTAMELDRLGLIIRHLDKGGRPAAFPVTREPESDQGRALGMSAGRLRQGLSSPHLTGIPGFEGLGGGIVGDLRGPGLTVTADDLVRLVIPRVVDALRMSDPAVPSYVELDDVPDHAAIDRQENLPMDEQSGVNDLHQGIDDGVLAGQRSMPVNSQPSHDSSPSVGAPNSAVRDTSNPTEGDFNTQGDSAP